MQPYNRFCFRSWDTEIHAEDCTEMLNSLITHGVQYNNSLLSLGCVTFSAFEQYPMRKSWQIAVFSFTFLCRYGQSLLAHSPNKKNLQVGILDSDVSCDRRHFSFVHAPFRNLLRIFFFNFFSHLINQRQCCVSSEHTYF